MPPTLLPDPSRLRLDYLSAYDGVITMVATTTAAEAHCPLCHQPSSRAHSRYIRMAADLPWNGVAVRLRLTTRRFFCDNDDCRRTIFTERLPDLIAPSARRTIRLTEALELIGFALGGEAGARTLAGLSMRASPDTVLRAIRAAILPERETPRVLGVDDFAFRKRHTYGTILVDLDRRCRVDLLPDRTAETLATWLAEHPGVEVIGRDRGGAYADGGRRGAPEAVQVADRWHLLCNVSETVERVLIRKHPRLREAAQHDPLPAASEHNLTAPEQKKRARRGSRVQRYETVRRLYRAGMTIAEIARLMSMSRNTASKYLRAEDLPERLPNPPGPASLLPYHAHLAERWQAGCHNGRLLWEEVRALGYPGSIQTVQRYLAPWRLHPRRGPSALPPTPLSPATPHRAARFFTQPGDALSAEDQTYLQRLRCLDPELDQLASLADSFRCMARDRDADALDGWLEQARGSGIDELVHFADHLQRDHAAVRAALSLPWSNGQTEGQVNRLKMLKRQMYGRANFDLLRKRVLHAA